MNSFSFPIVDFFLITLTLAIIILFIYKPRIGFLLFFLTKFTADLFWQHRLLGYNVNILQIQGTLFIIFCMVLVVRNKKELYHHPLKKILLALLVSNIVASAWGFVNSQFILLESVASPLSFMHIAQWNVRFLNLAGAFVIIPVIFSQKNDFRLMVRTFMFATMIPVVLGGFEFADKLFFPHAISGTGYSVQLFPRLTAGYHDSAVLAIILFTGLSSSFYLFFTEFSHKFKWIYFSYFLINLFLLYNTYSRTLWLTVAFFIILFLLFHKYFLQVLILLIVIITAFATLPSVQKRFQQEISYLKQDNTEFLTIEMTGTGRIGLWKITADHYRRLDFISKLIGTGGAYGSHNQFIAFLLKNGLIGLLFFFTFLYFVYRRLSRSKNMLNLSEYAMVMGLLISSVLIANQFIQLWDHITYNYFFWGLTGMLIYNPSESS